jgi:hypothetical protein
MKEGFDKEIDSLLRRLPNAPAGSRPRGNGANAPGADSHLDADELSAFAEGSLPASARVAASAHLADCDECRGLVVNLTRAAGVEAEIEKRAAASVPATTSEASRLRVWLASLFAPGALRYVAPALAVCLIAAVTFVALRSRRAGERVAQSVNTAAPRTSITNDQTTDTFDASQSSSSNTATNANASMPSAATSNAAGHAAVSTNGAVSENGPAREAPAGGPTTSAVTDGLDTTTAAPAQPKDAPAPPPAVEQKTTAAETVTTTNSAEQPRAAQTTEAGAGQSQQQASNLSRGETQQQTPDGSRSQARGVPINNRQNESAAGRDANIAGGVAFGVEKEDRDKSAGATAPATRRGRASDDKQKRAKAEEDSAASDDEAARNVETRSVAGHKFRREGGAWVDVNYKSSMSSTGVRRGTDSYRALVADIPELGRVAEQLGGEVIVVVRGRAYHIR